jgi:hypothetical protein
MLLPMCIKTLSSLSQTNFLNQLGFDIHDRIKIHKMLGYSIITFVGIHVCCHLRNFYMVSSMFKSCMDEIGISLLRIVYKSCMFACVLKS